jgi:uncharacterized membrane protein
MMLAGERERPFQQRKEEFMNELVVAVFDDEFKAEEVRLDLRKREAAHLGDLEDAVVLVRDKKGKVKLHHLTHFTIGGALGGGFLGTLFGIMLLNPVFAVLGLATGAAVGGISGAMSHVGINEDFMEELAAHLKLGASALCILVRKNLDKVLEDLKTFDGKVFHTSLQHTDEAKLKAAFEEIMASVGA